MMSGMHLSMQSEEEEELTPLELIAETYTSETDETDEVYETDETDETSGYVLPSDEDSLSVEVGGESGYVGELESDATVDRDAPLVPPYSPFEPDDGEVLVSWYDASAHHWVLTVYGCDGQVVSSYVRA